MLEALFRGLVAMRVKPYYLHHPDLAPGTGAFPRSASTTGSGWSARCAGASRGCASRPMCSTSPAATARCRSRASAAPPARGDGRLDRRPTAPAARHRYPPRAGCSATGAEGAAHAADEPLMHRRRRRCAGAQYRARDLPAARPSRRRAVAARMREFAGSGRGDRRAISSPARRTGATASSAPGSTEAVTILALSRDDQLNLHAALRARDANPRIRIVLRQFNRTLARKIEQNLPDCSVLSLAWHSAATYAASALDPSCFRGLQFPERGRAADRLCRRARRGRGRRRRRPSPRPRRRSALRVVAVDGETEIDRDDTDRAAARGWSSTARSSGSLHSTPRQRAAGDGGRRDRSARTRCAAASAAAPGRPVSSAPLRGARGRPVLRRHLAFPLCLRQRLADRGLFRAGDDDDDRLRRHDPGPQQSRRHRHGDDADAVRASS